MRNPNGYGTVYKLSGSNRRNPFVAKVTSGWSRDGKQQYEVIGYYPTRQDALIALAAFHNGTAKAANQMTLADVYAEWSSLHFDKITKSTRSQYEAAFAKMKRLHRSKFMDLRTGHFQRVIQEYSDQQPGTLGKIKVLASMLYRYALQHDIVNKDYSEFIELPKRQAKEKSIFTDPEIQILWNHEGENRIVDIILILLYTGFRINELLRVTRFHVDWEQKVIIGGSKTDSGKNRIVPIHPKIEHLVRRYYQNATGEKLFPGSYEQFRHLYYETLERLGIEKKNPHSTRHTFATRMNRGGANTKALQQIIGHANYSTTANLYTHTNLDDLRKAMEAI